MFTNIQDFVTKFTNFARLFHLMDLFLNNYLISMVIGSLGIINFMAIKLMESKVNNIDFLVIAELIVMEHFMLKSPEFVLHILYPFSVLFIKYFEKFY